MGEIKPIETSYHGYRFRSRAEARWAVFFEHAGIPFEYEPEGVLLSDGSCYLPDFWLPKCKTWFEVKGVLTEKDDHKITQLIKDTNLPCVIGFSDLSFSACDWWEPIEDGEEKWWGTVNPTLNRDLQYERTKPYNSILCKCKACGGLWFMGWTGSFKCRCCGEHWGDDHLIPQIEGDLDWFLYTPVGQCARRGAGNKETVVALYAARGARFEHGERGDCGRLEGEKIYEETISRWTKVEKEGMLNSFLWD